MRILRQRRSECFITSIAVAANVRVKVVRRCFEKEVGLPYLHAIRRGTNLFHIGAIKTLKKFLGTHALKAYVAVFPEGCKSSYGIGSDAPTLPKKGRGIFIVGAIMARHSIAYQVEDFGVIMVYDGNHKHPCSWQQWKEFHPEWWLEAVVPTIKKEKKL